MMIHILRLFLCLLLPIGVSAQNVNPPEEVGVFMEILDEGIENGLTATTSSLNIRFNAFIMPPSLSGINAFHIVLEVNNSSTILLDFITTLDRVGLPDDMEMFEEEGGMVYNNRKLYGYR